MGTDEANEAIETEAIEVLRGVIDPELGDDIVSLGMVRGVRLAEPGVLSVEVALTVAACPLRGQIQSDVERRLSQLAGVSRVKVEMG
ncbi:MAG: metal-sulfur cluster assembly factor, partial [Acidimicrobiales bacterium]